MKRTLQITIAKLLMASLLPALVFAQNADEPRFPRDLARELERNEWNAAAIEEVVTAAQELEWDQAEGADPVVVAMALEFGAAQDSELSGPEQAQLALELAISAVQMEAAGVEQIDMARAALNGVRTAIGEIQAWHDGGRSGNLGEIVRMSVATSVSQQVRKSTAAMGAGRAAEILGRLSTLSDRYSMLDLDDMETDDGGTIPGL